MEKMITSEKVPVTNVVTIFLTASDRWNAVLSGFQMQVNRFIMKNTLSVPAKCRKSCKRSGPGFQQFEVSLECQESSIYWTLFVNFCFIFL